MCSMKQYEKYMAEALVEAKKALDSGEFPVGCVMVADNRILVRGYRQNSGTVRRNEIDHAEVVTLRRLIREQPELDLSTVTVYSTMEPCLMCFATMLLSGIRTIVWAYEDVMGGGTNLNLSELSSLYAAMEVKLVGNVLRSPSLALFQQFFRDYSYWEDSELAQYTAMQQPEVFSDDR